MTTPTAIPQGPYSYRGKAEYPNIKLVATSGTVTPGAIAPAATTTAAAVPAGAVITVGSSPYAYTSAAAAGEVVTSTGGTVSSITLTRGGFTSASLGTAGLFVLSLGDVLTFTHTGAPTAESLPFAPKPTVALATASATGTVTVAGVALGDQVIASYDHDLGGCTISAYVNDGDSVTWVITNPTNGSVTPAAGKVTFVVLYKSEGQAI